MPDFQYVAKAMNGEQVTGLVSAGSETEVVSTLAMRQLFPMKIELAESAKQQERARGRRVKAMDVANFFSQLADLLRSGVPLMRSLELLERQARSQSLKLVINEVRSEVSEGTRLAEAVRHHPRVFNDLAVSMVRAGEEGGFLEDVLKRIATFTEHQEDMKGRVKGALAYPVVLSMFGAGVVTAMMIWFVPKFEPIFQRFKDRGELPMATTVVVGMSHAIADYGLYLLGVAVLAGYFAFRHFETPEGRLQLDNFRLKIPMAGAIYRSLAIARFCRILGTLLKNGVPILNSLRIAKDATGNRVLSVAIGGASEGISAGKSLAQPLRASKQFPDEIVEMIAVAEEANNLEQVLVDVADGMERRTYRSLELFVRFIEPVMLVVMAGVVLFVMLGLLLPVLQSSSVL